MSVKQKGRTKPKRMVRIHNVPHFKDKEHIFEKAFEAEGKIYLQNQSEDYKAVTTAIDSSLLIDKTDHTAVYELEKNQKVQSKRFQTGEFAY